MMNLQHKRKNDENISQLWNIGIVQNCFNINICTKLKASNQTNLKRNYLCLLFSNNERDFEQILSTNLSSMALLIFIALILYPKSRNISNVVQQVKCPCFMHITCEILFAILLAYNSVYTSSYCKTIYTTTKRFENSSPFTGEH